MRGVSAREALDGALTAFTAAGVETPRLDAEILLAHALGVDRTRLHIERDLRVEGPAVRAFQDAVRRRAAAREPVAYITGVRGFRRLELAVDRRALIPRPETELLVEVAQGLPPGGHGSGGPPTGSGLPVGARVLDVGTGSGAVALALKDERPDLAVTGSDMSAQALALARENGERTALEVAWLQADLLDGVADEHDAVVCNPPYVADGERASLAPEILRHEPPGALFAGPDGLAVISRLCAQLAVRPSVCFVALEVGAGQAPSVTELLRGAGFSAVRAARDLAGVERVVVGERPGI